MHKSEEERDDLRLNVLAPSSNVCNDDDLAIAQRFEIKVAPHRGQLDSNAKALDDPAAESVVKHLDNFGLRDFENRPVDRQHGLCHSIPAPFCQ